MGPRPPAYRGRHDGSEPGSLEVAVVHVPAMADRVDVEDVLGSVPVQDHALVADPEDVEVVAPEPPEVVVRSLPGLPELRLDALPQPGVEFLEVVEPWLGGIDRRTRFREASRR